MTKYTRNPYPVPDLSREGVWFPRGPRLGPKVVPDFRDWDIGLKPHDRLFAHHTLNSIRKNYYLIRPQVPQDSLDLALSSVYVHNKDTLIPKEYVLIQPETLGRPTWRTLRNYVQVPPQIATDDVPLKRIGPNCEESHRAKCYRGPTTERRIHPSSVKLSIEGQHTDQSNRGYSRKIDGTYYAI